MHHIDLLYAINKAENTINILKIFKFLKINEKGSKSKSLMHAEKKPKLPTMTRQVLKVMKLLIVTRLSLSKNERFVFDPMRIKIMLIKKNILALALPYLTNGKKKDISKV